MIRAESALSTTPSKTTGFLFQHLCFGTPSFGLVTSYSCDMAIRLSPSWKYIAPSLKYIPPSSDYVENVERYQPGGFHPVHLGDTLSGGRYRIIHKLGHGGFATVWLAREESQKRYVALKIMEAETSSTCFELEILHHLEASSDQPGKKHVSSVLDHFSFEGPNGVHICIVSKVGGPSIAQLNRRLNRKRTLRGALARKLAGQSAHALEFLHSNRVVHGGMMIAVFIIHLPNSNAPYRLYIVEYSPSNR